MLKAMRNGRKVRETTEPRRRVPAVRAVKYLRDLQEIILRLPNGSFELVLAYALRDRHWGWLAAYADAVGIKRGTANVRWHRLVKRLKNEMEQFGWSQNECEQLTDGFCLRSAVESDAVRNSLASRESLRIELERSHRQCATRNA